MIYQGIKGKVRIVREIMGRPSDEIRILPGVINPNGTEIVSIQVVYLDIRIQMSHAAVDFILPCNMIKGLAVAMGYPHGIHGLGKNMIGKIATSKAV